MKAVSLLLFVPLLASAADVFDSADPCRAEREAWQQAQQDQALLTTWDECLAKADEPRKKEEAAEKAARDARERAMEARRKLPGVRIGMSASQVIKKTHWGPPEVVNKTVTSRGTTEQWVYGSGHYLYFENGRLTAVQTSE